jgi:hypothetical protein
MRYLSLFDDYTKVDESYNFDSDSILESKINQMLSLTTNGCAAGFTLNEFKELFRSDSLIESQGYDESEALLEKAYSVYEIGMLQEAKSHWFDENKPQIYEHSRGVISYLEFEGNILLFKDGEAFMVNERSLKMIHDQDQSINEDLFDLVLGDKLYEWWSWSDNPITNGIKGAAKWANTNIVQPAAKIVKTYVVDPLKSAWDALSTGAKKVYEFAKKILSAIGTFIKENWQDIVFYITVALQVIAGIVAFIPAAGQVVGPVLLIIAGSIQVFLGGYDIFEGIKIVRECPVDPMKKAAPEFIKGGAKLLGGGVSLLLGIHDIVTSPKAAAPGGALASTAVAVPAKSWVSKTVTALGTSGAAIGMFETLIKFLVESGGKVITKAGVETVISSGGKYAAKKTAVIAGEALTKAGAEIIGKKLGDKANEAAIPMLCIAGNYALGWLWDIILGAIAGFGKMINGILDLPKKTVSSIDEFNKKHSGSIIGSIIGGALKTFVSPVAKVLAWFCENKIKPIIKPVTNWMIGLGKHNKSIKKSVESTPALKAAVSGGKIPQPKGGIPGEKVEVSPTDKRNLTKIESSKTAAKGNTAIAKEGGFFTDKFKKIQEENIAKAKKQQEKIFNDKFPGVINNKASGQFVTNKDGSLCFKYKSSVAKGTVILYNNGRYQVKDGPNAGVKGDYNAKKNIGLHPPKDGWKKESKGKNESMRYLDNFDGFSLI